MPFFNKRFKVPLIYNDIPSNNKFNNILLINRAVKNFEEFVNSANENTFPIVYSYKSTKEDLLALLKANFTSISRIGILFTNVENTVPKFLDNKPLFIEDEEDINSENVKFIIDIINDFQVKNIDYLACDTLNNDKYVQYYNILTTNTGTTLGASNDKTGNLKSGGDWVMENTKQDIELTYFNKNVEYYKYLLDSLNPWVPTTTIPWSIVTDGTYIYYTSNAQSIYRININTKEQDPSWYIDGFNDTYGLAYNNNCLYVADNNASIGTIYKIFINNPSNLITLADNLGFIVGITYYDNYLYYTNNNYSNVQLGSIGKISIHVNGSNDPTWKDNLEFMYGITNNGDYLYIASGSENTCGGNNVFSIKISNKEYNVILSNSSYFTFGLVVYGTTLFIANISQTDSITNIVKINLINNNVINSNFAEYSDSYVLDLLIYDSYLYLSFGGSISGIDRIKLTSTPTPTPTPTPISNICFSAKTPFKTNKGFITIDKINPDIHTIDNKKIVAITKTISNEKCLIRFGRNALGMNYPTKETIVSRDHKILYKGKMIEASKFVGHFPNVTKIEYNGEILYNIVMEKYDKVKTNNLICETLHPQNKIAKLFTSKLPEDCKERIIIELNKSIENKDYKTYKQLINKV